MSKKSKAQPAGADAAAPSGIDTATAAQLRLGCLKLASLFRTESTTPEQMKAKADEFLAYVLGAKS